MGLALSEDALVNLLLYPALSLPDDRAARPRRRAQAIVFRRAVALAQGPRLSRLLRQCRHARSRQDAEGLLPDPQGLRAADHRRARLCATIDDRHRALVRG